MVDVLVAGAGPTGLMLALWLTRLGVRVRIIDKTEGPGTTSRALVMHARTLEFYRQLGLADEAIARGLKFAAATLWARGARAGRIVFGDMGQGLSPYPYMLILAQDRQEELLIEHLRRLGVEVERRTELLGFEDRGENVAARLRRPDGIEESCECAYVAGCDGAHSTVRETLKLEFPGGTYSRMFYVADVHASGPVINGELNVALDEADFLAVFPLAGEGTARLIGTIEETAEEAHQALRWEDVSQDILRRLKITVERVNWFSTYRVHHRVAPRFRVGRAFVLGDAAHIHSPVGGQGMNTGLGDAVNLSWKLAMALDARADDRLLDTYEAERIAFARRLVATTDRAFTFVTRDGPIARLMRLDVVPRLIPAAMRLPAARRYMFRTVSQIMIRYRDSPISAGRAGQVHGGDRLPWVEDNFAPLASLQWQVHVYGEAREDLAEACFALALPLHRFPWSAAAGQAGLQQDALYLVRPDGYVALADANADPDRLGSYLAERALVVQPMATSSVL
jgi:2-polyprenyl-6-methoxyphenol hydroxylase-like FAD-dependent oxidoreductase